MNLKNNMLEYVSNPQAISSVFGEQLIDLEKLMLWRFLADEKGSAEIILRLSDYPQRPPLKWQRSHYNTVNLHLRLIEIHKINLKKWAFPQEMGKLEINRIGELISLKTSGDCELELDCRWIQVIGLEAFASA
jgi:Immunity protein 50